MSPNAYKAKPEENSISSAHPFSVWLSQYTVDDPDAVAPKAVLRAAYGAACEQKGIGRLTETAFGYALKRARPKVTGGQRTVNSRRQHCYIGIGMADSTSPTTDSSHWTDQL